MYGFMVKIKGSVEDGVKRVTEALSKEGFGVLTEIDVQATLKKKLNLERKPYRILGACNPQLAHQALEAEPDVGLLLPCNVIVREEDDGSVTVGIVDPISMLGVVKNPKLEQLGEEARARLERVRDAIKS